LGCERPDYPPRIWRRCRVRSRTKSDTDSNACDAIGITESEPVSISGSNPGTDSNARANSGANHESDRDSDSNACDAIGITDANADSYSKADSVGISESVTGTVGD